MQKAMHMHTDLRQDKIRRLLAACHGRLL